MNKAPDTHSLVSGPDVPPATIDSDRDVAEQKLRDGVITWSQFLDRCTAINLKYTGTADPAFDKYMVAPLRGILRLTGIVLLVGIPSLVAAAIIKWAWITLSR